MEIGKCDRVQPMFLFVIMVNDQICRRSLAFKILYLIYYRNVMFGIFFKKMYI